MAWSAASDAFNRSAKAGEIPTVAIASVRRAISAESSDARRRSLEALVPASRASAASCAIASRSRRQCGWIVQQGTQVVEKYSLDFDDARLDPGADGLPAVLRRGAPVVARTNFYDGASAEAAS